MFWRGFPLITLLLAVATSQGLASTGGDWKAAKSKDTIEAYESFLQANPTGKSADRALARIWDLTMTAAECKAFLERHPGSRHARSARRRLALEEESERRLERLKAYRIGETTLKQFAADSFSGADATRGTIGILAYKCGSTTSCTIMLGNHFPPVSSEPDAFDRFSEWLMSPPWDVKEDGPGNVFDFTNRAYADGDQKVPVDRMACVLVFTDGTLTAVQWPAAWTYGNCR